MRITQFELDLKAQVAGLGESYTIHRHTVSKRHARAIFDLKFNGQPIGTAMTVQEMSAAATVVANLLAIQVSDETVGEVIEDAVEQMAEEATEKMPEEESVD
jgi:hypothetical protein